MRYIECYKLRYIKGQKGGRRGRVLWRAHPILSHPRGALLLGLDAEAGCCVLVTIESEAVSRRGLLKLGMVGGEVERA